MDSGSVESGHPIDSARARIVSVQDWDGLEDAIANNAMPPRESLALNKRRKRTKTP